MMDAPIYLYTYPTAQSEQSLIQRLEAGKTVWTYILVPGLTKTTARLALDSLFITVCPNVISDDLCETLRLRADTGQVLSDTPGQLWTAAPEYAVVVEMLSKTARAVDFFTFKAHLIDVMGETAFSGAVNSRLNCGQFDVLGARPQSRGLALTLRDGCGVWRKVFLTTSS